MLGVQWALIVNKYNGIDLQLRLPKLDLILTLQKNVYAYTFKAHAISEI